MNPSSTSQAAAEPAPPAAGKTAGLASRWDDREAAGLEAAELLCYRSNLLGTDKRITNFGGGNTSSKIVMADPLTGDDTTVLWVKGSGGDLGSITRAGFATLYQDKLLGLQSRYPGQAFEDAMVPLYAHCGFGLNARAPSIDTPLHALVDKPHVDHMHPDAVIAIAAAADGEALTQAIYGEDIGWLPWMRPGFELALRLRRFVAEHPQARGVVLQAHGLVTWGETQKACYENTVDVIHRAASWLAAQARPEHP